MATKKYEHPIVKYSELAAQRRGIVIEKTIALEKIVDLRISYYFCKDESKREELDHLVLSNMTFSAKINILLTLYTRYSKDIFQAYPNLEKDLSKIRKYRNELAHSWLDTSVTFVGNRSKFKPQITNLKNKGKDAIYDEARIKEILALILKYTTAIYHWEG